MTNPFVFARPLGPEPVVPRPGEFRALIDYYETGVNTRLSSPRDYGKTSLLNQVCAEVNENGGGAVLVDLYGATTGAQMAAQIDRAYGSLPRGGLLRAADSIRRRGGGGGINTPIGGATMNLGGKAAGEALLLDALSLPARIHEKTGIRLLVALDEFQVVLKSELDGLIRSVIQHHGAGVTYVFCGSHPGMMRELFSNRSRPFYGQATPVELGRLEREPLADFVIELFEQTGKDPGRGLRPLLDLVDGHPQRAMLMAHLLWDEVEPGGEADEESWNRAFAAAWPYLQEKFAAIWDEATRIEAGVLEATAVGEQSLTGKRAQSEFGLPRGSAAFDAAKRLVDDGILIRDEASGLSIDDPLFATWVASGRRWPTGEESE
jgi:hypothetical protein